MSQLADLLETDLDFPTGDNAADEHTGRRLLQLRLDLVRNAQPAEQAGDIHAAWTARVSDRFGGEQRLLECLGGVNVWSRRTRTHGHADARTGEIDPTARYDLAGLDEVVDRRGGHDDKVVRFTRRNPLLRVERPRENRGDLVPRRLFELHHQL